MRLDLTICDHMIKRLADRHTDGQARTKPIPDRTGKKRFLIITIAARAIFSPRVHMLTMAGRGHDLEVSLQGFMAALRRCFLPYCIPTKPLIWAFIKWVHGRSTGAPALVSHRPSVGSKFSIYLCYERHVERTMGVTLRGALGDNCLTILVELWSFCPTFDLFFGPWVTFCDFLLLKEHVSNDCAQTVLSVVFRMIRKRRRTYVCGFEPVFTCVF